MTVSTYSQAVSEVELIGIWAKKRCNAERFTRFSECGPLLPSSDPHGSEQSTGKVVLSYVKKS
jgi:hypothetical protein